MKKRKGAQHNRGEQNISSHFTIAPKMRMPKGNSECSLYIAKILTTNMVGLVSDSEWVGEKRNGRAATRTTDELEDGQSGGGGNTQVANKR